MDRASRTGAAVCALLVVLAALEVAPAPCAAQPPAPRITARAGLVMDAASGEILWADDADTSLPPASTTKVLTTVLALESGRLDEVVTVSRVAQAQAPSKLDLRAGQRVRLIDLTYALMLKSANDAAVVVAEGLSGSVEAFAARMNSRARALGATGSQFRNPNGLPDDAHVSTARDLALIFRHALSVPGFRGIAATPATQIPVTGSATRMVSFRSHNRLLQGYGVPVIGKTGYTRAAGRCFVGSAELAGREVVVVVLGSTNLWGDTRRLIEYGLTTLAPEAAAGVQLAAPSPAPARRASTRSVRRSVAQAPAKRPSGAAKATTKPGRKGSSGSASTAAASRSAKPACSGASCASDAQRLAKRDPSPSATAKPKRNSGAAGVEAGASSRSSGR